MARIISPVCQEVVIADLSRDFVVSAVERQNSDSRGRSALHCKAWREERERTTLLVRVAALDHGSGAGEIERMVLKW